ncbi:hypothetical protein V5799_001182 [Amblyomma americanum]|uniref:Uncharacterized protein n=1 Tax=Amblyomma americanum TaxID=6943 RepID=A0AAQ4D0X9_AMBAM
MNIEQHGISTCGSDPPLFTAPSVTSAASATLTSHYFKSSHISFFGTGHGGTLSEVTLKIHFVFLAQVLGFVLPDSIARVNTCFYDSDLITLNYCKTESYDAQGTSSNTASAPVEPFNHCSRPPAVTSAASATLTSHYFKSSHVSFFSTVNGGTLSEVTLRNHFVFLAQVLGFVLPDSIPRVNTCIYDSDLKTLNYCKTESYDATRNIEQHGISTCGTGQPLFTATSVTWAAAATLTSHCFKSSHVSFFGTGQGGTLSEVMLMNHFNFLVQFLGFAQPGCIARVNTCIYDSGLKTLIYCNIESYDATRNIEQHGISTSGTDPPLFKAQA